MNAFLQQLLQLDVCIMNAFLQQLLQLDMSA